MGHVALDDWVGNLFVIFLKLFGVKLNYLKSVKKTKKCGKIAT